LEKLKTSTRQVEGVTIVDLSGRITLGEASVVVRDVINVFLYRENIGKLAVVLIAPEVMIGARIDKFCADDELFSTLHDAARDHSFDFQLTGGCLGINVRPLVARDNGAGHNGEIRNLREVIDEAFRKAVAEILLGVGVVAGVNERQHCDGRNFLVVASAVEQRVAARPLPRQRARCAERRQQDHVRCDGKSPR
jgi:hypothetical protein